MKTFYKVICRCANQKKNSHNTEGNKTLNNCNNSELNHFLSSIHEHSMSCRGCTTSAFVRYRAATCAIYRVNQIKNRLTVFFGSKGRQMIESFRLFTKEDIKCLFTVISLYNPIDLTPAVIAYDKDVWWSVVYHFGSISECIRNLFVEEVAQALLLSFHL